MADDAPEAPDQIAGAPHPSETRRLFGQGAAEAAVIAALDGGRFHHAWLLRGPRGIGKATLAYRITRRLLTEAEGPALFDMAPASLDPPEDCPARTRIVAGVEPRLFVLRRTPNPRTGKMRAQIAVEDVRAAGRFLTLSAADGGWRAIIVDAADELNTASANALLKFLEEPPPRTAFFLVSHAPAGLLPTIRSRCRTLDFAPLGPRDLAAALGAIDEIAVPADTRALAELTGGSVARALELLAGDGVGLYAELVRLCGDGGRLDRVRMARFAQSCAGREADGRYARAAELILLLQSRLARAAALGAPETEAAEGEAALMQVCAAHPGQARLWAETHAESTATLRHARAVNLDPAQTIIDTLLEMDTTLGRARAL